MSNPRAVRLFYDYIDPASFLLDRRLRQWADPNETPLALVPFEISVPPAPLLDPNEAGAVAYWEKLKEAARPLGFELKRPWIVPWSRKAHELAMEARQENCFREIHNALFRAYLLEGLDIGRIDVLVDLSRQQGMDPVKTKAVLDVDKHRAAILSEREAALRAGISRSPTVLRPGGRLEGYPDEETLREFVSP